MTSPNEYWIEQIPKCAISGCPLKASEAYYVENELANSRDFVGVSVPGSNVYICKECAIAKGLIHPAGQT